jgi:hypothetical protein
MADSLKLFNKYRTKPTLGQATENPIIDTIETTFANVPFAAQILRRAAEESTRPIRKSIYKKCIRQFRNCTKTCNKLRTKLQVLLKED